ncbi:MAG: metal-dependent hydrolase, partial [Proteobacteria bacterium]
MDNFTHTLIGGAYYSVLPKRLQNKPILLAATIGSNLPDFDVLMRFFPGETHFDYLVHHRGYTHTFLLALPFALTLACILKKCFKDQATFLSLALVSLGGVFLHLFADFWNDYGVHPLTPFSNQWFYGDSIFIVEPYLWMALIPLMVSLLTSKRAKFFFKGLFVLSLALVW